VVIPPDFAGQVARGDAQVLIILDGSDTFVVPVGLQRAREQIAQAHGRELMMVTARRMGRANMAQLPSTVHPYSLQSNIDELIFLIPGLTAMLLQLVCVKITVTSVVRERELGTMEQILVTPTRPLERLWQDGAADLVVAVDLLIIIGLVFTGSKCLSGISTIVLLAVAAFHISRWGWACFFRRSAKIKAGAANFGHVDDVHDAGCRAALPARDDAPVVAFITATWSLRRISSALRAALSPRALGISFLWNDVIA
jgi:ABC-2 type transport system permease protein